MLKTVLKYPDVQKALDEIVTMVSKTTDLIGEIAAACNEQAQGIGQINVAVSEMDKATQQNAANAEQSASASQELDHEAVEMNQITEDLLTMVGKLKSASQTILDKAVHVDKVVDTTGREDMSVQASQPSEEFAFSGSENNSTFS